MTLDPLILSRLQFAWVVAWHILLPALTIGLASYIALLGSLILTHDVNGVVPGLKDYPPEDRAPVIIPFFASVSWSASA